MSSAGRRVPQGRSPQRRSTLRMRLTLTYTALFTGAGALLVAILYLFMRFGPTYDLEPVSFSESVELPVPGESLGEATGGNSEEVQWVSAVSGNVPGLVITDQRGVLDVLLGASLVILFVLAAVSAVAGWIIAGRMLRPLLEINEAAQLAASGSLGHRIGLSGPADEVTQLGDTFDHMLSRLELAFTAHERFAANASHELRSPLATTQAMLDVAMRKVPLAAEEQTALLTKLRAKNRDSIDTVEAILDLADLGHLPVSGEIIDLAETVRSVGVGVGVEAAERSIEVTVEEPEKSAPVRVAADPVLVAQLVENLLRNGIRHNIEGGEVVVAVAPVHREGATWAELRVTNTGAELSAEEVARFREPFFRGAGRVEAGLTRSRGIGLAFVDSMVTAHGGTLEQRPRAGGGLETVVRLPAAPSTE